jgi:hypothetical protein
MQEDMVSDRRTQWGAFQAQTAGNPVFLILLGRGMYQKFLNTLPKRNHSIEDNNKMRLVSAQHGDQTQ